MDGFQALGLSGDSTSNGHMVQRFVHFLLCVLVLPGGTGGHGHKHIN
jgi:hypothetical protein